MNIGIIGSGGREHSLCVMLKQSRIVDKIYCFPGNAGTALIAENIEIGKKEGRLCNIPKNFTIQEK